MSKKPRKNIQVSLLHFFNITLIPLQEKVNFARHLSIGIKSGLSLLDTLDLIKQQTSSKRFSAMVSRIMEDINNGQSLADSLERFNYVFGHLFISMVRVGEVGGNLSGTLAYLSNELKKQRELHNRVKSAMIYPAIILIVTIGITVFLTLFIFPKILPIFQSLGVQLPASTRLIIQTLSFLDNFGFLLLVGMAVFAIAVRALLFIQKVRYGMHAVSLRIPFVSTLIINVTITSFSRVLAALLKSGMTLLDALVVVKTTISNLVYQRHVEQMIEVVRRGEEMTKYLKKYPRLFPPMLVGMIKVGEGTGNLEDNLLYLAEYYESEVDETVNNLTTILEPLLLLFMGVIVGFIALSIITPIYKVTQGLNIR